MERARSVLPGARETQSEPSHVRGADGYFYCDKLDAE